MFFKLLLIIHCIVSYSLSSPISTQHDSHLYKREGNPASITNIDLKVIEELKSSIIKYTEETDKIIFVGNTPSYVYYSFKPSDNRRITLVPYSGSWMDDFEEYSEKSSITQSISKVKQYCADFIDPLGLNSNEKIVLVDISYSGDGIWQFKELLKACVMKDYVPRETPEHEFLHVEFLDMLGTDQYLLKISEYWGIGTENGLNPSETFGFARIKDIIVYDSNGSDVIAKFDQAGDEEPEEGHFLRLVPKFTLEIWGNPESSIEEFQKDDLVRENIQMIRAYFKDM